VRPDGGERSDRAADDPATDAAAGRGIWLVHFRDRRIRLFTVAAILAYGAIEATIIHRIARFQELGFSLATVTAWAAISGLLTLPGRFLLPALANRLGAAHVLALVLGVLAAGTALMITGDAYWQLALSFVLFGLVFGAALPLRPLVMGQWTPLAVFGRVMGIQAALIAFGRAGLPALAGGLHDLLGGYSAAMALLTALLALSAVLVVASVPRR
jgi:MFS family permease